MKCTLIWQTARLSRRTLLQRLGAAGMLVVLRPASAWATQETVQQAMRQLIGAREPQPLPAIMGGGDRHERES